MGLDCAVDTHRLGISPGQPYKFTYMVRFAAFMAEATPPFSPHILPP